MTSNLELTSVLSPLPLCGAMAPGVECLLLGKGVTETVGQSERLVSTALVSGTVLAAALWSCPDSCQQSQGGSITILLVVLSSLLPLPEKVPQRRGSAAQVI